MPLRFLLAHGSAIVLVFSWLCFAGCGGASVTNAPTPAFTGNWDVSLTQTSPSSVICCGSRFEIYLSQSGPTISGEAMGDIGCFPNGYAVVSPVSVSGRYQNGELDFSFTPPSRSPGLPSEPSNLVVQIQAQPAETLVTGNFFFAGSCGAGIYSGHISAQKIPYFSGNWDGSLTSAAGSTLQVAANLTGDLVRDSTNLPGVAGTVVFSGTSCFSSGTFNGDQIGAVIPNGTITTDDGVIQLQAGYDSQGNLHLRYSTQGGKCNGDYGTGILSLR